MYYKEINGRIVFSDCKTIQMPNGTWISNPTPEQIEQAGFAPYTPPPVIPTPQTEPDYEEVVAAIKKILSRDTEELSDEDALEVAALYPTWASKIGEQVNVGERYWYDGTLWKVVQAHTVQEDWKPDLLPSLYTEVSIEEIPEWVQPIGATGLYMTGDKVKHNGLVWVSIVDNNSWEPGGIGTESLWREIVV